MSDETAVVKRNETAMVSFRQATDVASMCKQIVLATAIEIQRRKYVKVEGWQAIAVAHGCVASARDVQRIEGGVRAIGEVRRGSDGIVLSTAEGFVGDDESTWGGRAEYAKRAMAQTRAISRACRSAFAHVVVLMNAGLETTPAEEVPAEGFENAKQVKPVEVKTVPPAPAAPAATPVEQPPAPDNGVLVAEVVIGEVAEKSGESKRGKWTRYYSRCDDGEYYTTFDAKLGTALYELEKRPAIIKYVIEVGPTGKPNRKIISIECVRVPDSPVEPDPDAARKDGLPF